MSPWRGALAGSLLLLTTGCGAAYYGAAIAVFATQEDETTVDTSFPDAVPVDGTSSGLATLTFSSGQTTQGGVTDYEVVGLEFTPGYGQTISNRDAGQTLVSGDRLVIRLHNDASLELAFGATDTASVGSQVAATIQAKVRSLATTATTSSTTIYSAFTASFDQTTQAYTFRSGLPGNDSAVAFEPAVRAGVTEAAPDTASGVTASRLGLGLSNGALETRGGDVVSLNVLNRGTDAIVAGTPIDLYLSPDKALDKAADVLFDRIILGETVAVGEVRRFVRSNGGVPPGVILRPSLRPGRYFLIFDVNSSGGETTLTNNTFVSPTPVQVVDPIDDPATAANETAAGLDFALVDTASPISAVSGGNFGARLTVSNLGEQVPTGGVQLDLEVVLSTDQTLDEPGGFFDATGAVAGVRLNPTNPVQGQTVTLSGTGMGAIAVARSGATLTVTYDPANGDTVQALIDALNGVTGTPIEAVADGNGAPSTDALTSLVTALGSQTSATTGDVFFARRRVTFSATTAPSSRQAFAVTGAVRTTAFLASVLPTKLYPIFRIKQVVAGATAENTKNNARVGRNFVRLYDRAQATFDANTSTTLPTVNSDDFARLEAVTQRPVNTGSIRQGQQRVFSFEIPASGLTNEESQLLVILRSTSFDAHIDLLSGSGDYLAGSDDTTLGTSPVLFRAVQAASSNRIFYLVVSSARFDESDLAGGDEVFNLTISVNPRQVGDPGPVQPVDARGVSSNLPSRYASASTPRTRNDVFVPFSLGSSRAEVLFLLPARARVRLITRPVFQVGVSSVITQFLENTVPAPVEHQPTLDLSVGNAGQIVYRPSGGSVSSTHTLEPGVYTFAVSGNDKLPDTQNLRLEIETEFLPD